MTSLKYIPKPQKRSLGSVYLDNTTGAWVAALERQDPATGKRKMTKRYHKGPGAKLAAERTLSKLIEESGRGLLEGRSSITVGNWLRQALERRNKNGAATTVRENTRLIGLALKHLDALELVKVTPLHIRGLIDSLEDYSHRTQLKVLQLVRGALEEAVSMELLTRNPASTIKVPREATVRHGNVWTLEEVAKFLKAATSRRSHIVFLTMLSTGMRISEALALQLGDVDFKARRIKVQRTFSGTGRAPVVTEGKTEAAKRTVPLSPILADTLRKWLKRRSAEQAQAGTLWQEAGWLLPSSNGTPLQYHNVVRDLAELCEKAEVPLLKSHDLRRTYITLAIRQGIAPEVVARLVGHKGVKLTLEVYRRVSDEETQSAVLKLTK